MFNSALTKKLGFLFVVSLLMMTIGLFISNEKQETTEIKTNSNKIGFDTNTEPSPEPLLSNEQLFYKSYLGFQTSAQNIINPRTIEKGIRALQPNPTQDISVLEKLGPEENAPESSITNFNVAVSSDFLFFGDAIQPDPPANVAYDAFGHGLGLSQWGAYGAANHGWTAEEIVTHYYKDTHVETLTGSIMINVQGYDNPMTMENYVSGLGEVPSKACGTQQDVDDWEAFADSKGWAQNDAKRDKYVVDDRSTPWDCWPEESIEAQVITARSFGYTSSQPICTSSACQVYNGGKAKKWAAWETKNQYIVSDGSTHNGQVIQAFYSAYNHNGWGTADHATIWGNNSGTSSSWSYLQARYDADVTYHHEFSRSAVEETDVYSLSDMDDMIDWCSTPGNCNSYAWVRDNVNNIIGNLVSLQLTKDPSGRVKKVTLTGTNGNASTSGIYFRAMFNKWVDAVRPNGVTDKIPSITFDIKIPLTAEEQVFVDQIKADIDDRTTGIANYNNMKLNTFEATTWSDTCMGIRIEGLSCNTVTVEGYLVKLKFRNKTWEYRSKGLDWFTYIEPKSI